MARRVPHKSSGKGKRAAQRRARAKQMGRAHVVLNNALAPIPQRYITKMKYSEVITTGALFGEYQMNLNSIFDPNRTGTGHQPYGFDTLASMYNRYRVISCGYRINTAAAAATSQNIVLTGLPANSPITASTASEIRENPRAKYIAQTPGGGTVYLTGKSYIPSLVGRTKAQYMADDRYQALTTANPAEEAVLNLQTFVASTDLPVSVAVQIVMEYVVEFFDIKNLGQS